ncbi:MAG: hypothetical protein DMG16_02795 [Acidobacteria bacterium]|nr:MAG: hypothetical protein DMG16_02795 [Acidobacteriota bacterium]
MQDDDKLKKKELEINDLTDSALTEEEAKSVKGGYYTGRLPIFGSGTLGATASEPPVSNGKDFSTNLNTKDADEDVD